MIIYCDLDETLAAPIRDRGPRDPVSVVRPGAQDFLRNIASQGRVVILTAAERGHAELVLPLLGRAQDYVSDIVSREDLAPIADYIDVIEKAEVNDFERAELYALIEPILPQGFVFDDFPVGSWMYGLKGYATATPPERWIEVEPYTHPQLQDRGGLQKAYREFLKRKARYQTSPMMAGIRRARRAYA